MGMKVRAVSFSRSRSRAAALGGGDDDAAWAVMEADGALGLVAVLTTGTAGDKQIDVALVHELVVI